MIGPAPDRMSSPIEITPSGLGMKPHGFCIGRLHWSRSESDGRRDATQSGVPVMQSEQAQRAVAEAEARRASEQQTRAREPSTKIEITPHPEWVEELLVDLEPYGRRITEHEFFEALGQGTLGLRQCRGALIYFYPLI